MFLSHSFLFNLYLFCFLTTWSFAIKEQLPLLKCPDNFIQSGKACLKIQYAEMILTCPKGSKFDGDMCLTKKNIPAEKQCPQGYKKTRDDKCEKLITIAPLTQCEKDHVFSRRVCTKTKRSEPELQCPPGYQLQGFTCSRIFKSQAKLTCAPGTTLIQDKMLCSRTETMEPILYCPKSFVLSENGVCVRDMVKPAVYECDRGFTLQDDTCLRYIDVGEPLFVCATGTLKGSKCIISDIQPGTLRCRADGFELQHGRCIKKTIEEPSVICEKDQTLTSSGECEIKREVQGTIRCPPGTVLDHKKCVASETRPLLEYCPDGYEETQTNKCILRQEMYPETVCPKTYTLRDNQCSTTLVLAPEISCPASTVLHDHTCEGVEIIPAKPTCHRGIVQNGVCVETLRKPIKTSCPSGYQRTEKFCVNHSYIKPEPFCENGELEAHSYCQYVSVQNPTKVCPKGFSVGLSLKCQKADATEAKSVCSYGMRLDRGICVQK